jgi:hypothetical protein
VNFRRASSLIQPQLWINNPIVLFDGGSAGGFDVWGGSSYSSAAGIDFDVSNPVDLGSPFSTTGRKQACAMCRSRCARLPPSHRSDCLDACPCDD